MENFLNQTSTNVKQVDIGFIDEMFSGAPSAENVIQQDEKPNNIFSTGAPDLSFIDNPIDKNKDKKPEDEQPEKKDEIKKDITADELKDILDIDPDTENTEGEGQTAKNGGRPKTDKSGLVSTFKKLIDSEKLIPFDDEKPLEDYTEKDFEDLLDANFQERERQLREATPQEFFESLPKEMQYAAKYVADGGKDLKGLFKALSHVEEVRALDPANENDQEQIIRSYLIATRYGDEKEINEEIQTWKDLGKLESKASTFKPKLDKMQEEQVQIQLKNQEESKKKQKEASEKFVDSVFEALKTSEINGLKLDKKTQAALYAGLTQPQYPSITGKQTNQLGHLLEKYQFIEPNFSLISEALWLLSNPEEYRASLKKQGKDSATEETVRSLKTAQQQKIANGQVEHEDTRSAGRKIARPQNIFAR